MWAQYDFGDGPAVGGSATVLFCLWLAWSRFRVVLPLLVPPPRYPGRAGRRRRREMGNRGLLRRGQGRRWARPLPGPPVPGLGPARHWPCSRTPSLPSPPGPPARIREGRKRARPHPTYRRRGPPPVQPQRPPDPPAEFHERWSAWRRRRQATARKSHYARRLKEHRSPL